MTKTVASKFQPKILKSSIEDSKYLQNSTKNRKIYVDSQ